MTNKDYRLVLVDPEKVQRRRAELGLTEARLGAQCGVSGGLIRRLETGRPQEEFSGRFYALLAEALGVPLADLLVRSEPSAAPSPDSEHTRAAELGAILTVAPDVVPLTAIAELTGWTESELQEAIAALHQVLPHVGQVLVDAGDALTIASDLAAASAEQISAATKAAVERRHPSLPQLRAVFDVMSANGSGAASRPARPMGDCLGFCAPSACWRRQTTPSQPIRQR